ncbi:MAG TPA: alpha/beta hydrolase [Porticoccaceae bacterium]|nr:alpha/beta hydrolase [Porticoccaceae bacterium]
MANRILEDSRIDPRIKARLAAWQAPPLRNVASREDMLASAASDKAVAIRKGLQAFFDSFDDQIIAPATGLTISHHRFVSAPDGNTGKICLIRPASSDPLPCIYYIHGGGMMSLSCYQGNYQAWGRLLAAQGVAVALVEFRNALTPSTVPEVAPYPAGLNDCVSGLAWLVAQAAELGLDAGRVVIAGDSGGANLAIATGLRLKRDNGLHRISGIYAMCPYIAGQWPDEHYPSSSENHGILLDLHHNQGAMAYGMAEFDNRNPLAWPGFATEEDVRGLVPVVVSVNECDPLRDEGIAFYRLLLRAGVRARCRTVMGTVHGIEVFPSICPDISRDTAVSLADFCRRG